MGGVCATPANRKRPGCITEVYGSSHERLEFIFSGALVGQPRVFAGWSWISPSAQHPSEVGSKFVELEQALGPPVDVPAPPTKPLVPSPKRWCACRLISRPGAPRLAWSDHRAGLVKVCASFAPWAMGVDETCQLRIAA